VKNRQDGFTLIELMAVITVLGLLTAFGLPNYYRLKQKARAAEVVSQIRAYETAVYQHYSDVGEFPREAYPGRDPGLKTNVHGEQGWRGPYLPGDFDTRASAMGGLWDWDNYYGRRRLSRRYVYGIGISGQGAGRRTLDHEVALAVDAICDDGNLRTGRYRKYGGRRGRYVYIMYTRRSLGQ
jgi:prepilin-type N-terminal cleavage/methylation domain-containing protein